MLIRFVSLCVCGMRATSVTRFNGLDNLLFGAKRQKDNASSDTESVTHLRFVT